MTTSRIASRVGGSRSQMSNYDPGLFMDLRGGLNEGVSDEFIQETELSKVENWVLDKAGPGILRKREGTTSHQTTAAAAVYIFDGIANNYYCLPTAIHTLSDGTARDTGLTSSTEPSMASLGAYDVFVNGTEARKSLNGTAWSACANVPAGAKYITFSNQFLFATGHDGAKVRWTSVGDPEDWPAANEWDLDSRGLTATGICTWNDQVVVSTIDSLFFLQGFYEDQIEIVNQITTEGCTSNRSFVPTEFGLFWWGRSGLNFTNNGTTATNLSWSKLSRTMAARNFGKDSLVHGLYNQDEQRVEMWFFRTGSTTQDIKLYYYPQLDSFWIGLGTGVEMGASGVVRENGINNIYVGTPAAGGVYLQSGDTDNGTPIAALLETKRHSPSGPHTIKNMTALTVYYYLQTRGYVDVGIYFNDSGLLDRSWEVFIDGGSGFILDSAVYGVLDTSVLLDVTPNGTDEEEIGVGWNFQRAKFYLKDDLPERTRFRGFLHEGVIVNA